MRDQPDDMMEAFDRWALRVVLWIALALILTGVILVLGLFDPAPAPRHIFSEAERQWVADRMRFHGISTSIYDPNTGEHYFIRDGKKCRL